jgi:hypothetical protein
MVNNLTVLVECFPQVRLICGKLYFQSKREKVRNGDAHLKFQLLRR